MATRTVVLDTMFTHHGKMYGPGEVIFDLSGDNPDDYLGSQARIADDLEAAQQRVQKVRDEEAAAQAANNVVVLQSEETNAPGLSYDQVQAMITQALEQQKQAFIDQGLLKLPDTPAPSGDDSKADKGKS